MSTAIGEGFLFVNAHMFVVADIDQAIISWQLLSEQRTLCGSIRPRMTARRVSWEQSVMIPPHSLSVTLATLVAPHCHTSVGAQIIRLPG
jgi:hypothetical protein